jgi:ABC-type oligopeptide transport system substrate-binding subunit
MSSMTTQSKARPVRLRAAIVIAGGAAFLAACSSGTTSSSSGTPAPPATSPASSTASPTTTITASAATCKHVASLNTSLNSLTHLQLNANASKEIRTDLTNIQTQLTALAASGGGPVSAQVSTLSSSLNRVEKAAKNLSANPSASQIQSIITALSGLKSNSKTTATQLKALCPGA